MKTSQFANVSAPLTLGPGYWCSLSEEQRRAVLRCHLLQAKAIISDHGLLLEDVALGLIVDASFTAFHMYVSAGEEDANPAAWGAFFERFVITCAGQELNLSSWMTDSMGDGSVPYAGVGNHATAAY